MGDLPTPTKVEQFNSLIRGGVLSVLTVAFGWKFLDGTVSTDAFISIYAGVLGWWFATRGQTPQPSVTTTTPSATTTATAETKP